VNRPAAAALGIALLAGLGAGGWALAGPDDAPSVTSVGAPSTTTSPSSTAATGTPSVASSSPAASPSPSSPPSPSTATRSAAALPKGLTEADVTAGLLSASYPQRGTGRLEVVPGSVKAPATGQGAGQVVTVRVEVEGGLKVDGAAFARFALATLNDDRSWAHDGYRFARTDGAADVRLVLASPDTSARLCLPLRTFGRLSCHSGDVTVLTVYRWVKGIPEYGKDLTGYRRYVVNHEVGHALGHGHLTCPGSGRRAPVMMQQTKGLKGCRPNSWPYPDEG
jgi:hypothetical protein